MEPLERIQEELKHIYKEKDAESAYLAIRERLAHFSAKHPSVQRYDFCQQDLVLITYADQFQREGQPALQGLAEFANRHLRGAFNTIHILPFFPYSSDDGFSIIDYYRVADGFGDWPDVRALAGHFRLMIDGVFNHVSRESGWFQQFKQGIEPYSGYFITVPPGTDLSDVMRPRTSPLLTAVKTAQGEKLVWTTFSDDQIDLNFANPQVLLEIIDVLLFYVEQGAGLIRIDAVPFLWKEIGTDCIHRPQTHALVRLLRAVLDAAAPQVTLITESNVPFKENISYLGDLQALDGQGDEAQLVYQFSLGPLVLHALSSGNASKLSDWVTALPAPYRYFNFIASHDGIGLLPAQGILSAADIQALIDQTEAHGGLLSYKTDAQGNRQVYELNISLYDFLNDPQQPQEGLNAARYLTSQTIMLELAGVPGVYVHSLFGSSNCRECMEESGRARSINREKFELGELEQNLAGDTRAARILPRYLDLARKRAVQPAFSPAAAQHVLRLDERVFALLRRDGQGGEAILCLSNLSSETLRIEVDWQERVGAAHLGGELRDLISEEKIQLKEDHVQITLAPYQSRWLV
ncbi:MAG: glucosylglycerate phosphorylase [Chloroflexota bacterium]|nr:glucosylglycerate phosphorylase [Chloroflexota bacterium]